VLLSMSCHGIGDHCSGIIFSLQAKNLGKIDVDINLCGTDGGLSA